MGSNGKLSGVTGRLSILIREDQGVFNVKSHQTIDFGFVCFALNICAVNNNNKTLLCLSIQLTSATYPHQNLMKRELFPHFAEEKSPNLRGSLDGGRLGPVSQIPTVNCRHRGHTCRWPPLGPARNCPCPAQLWKDPVLWYWRMLPDHGPPVRTGTASRDVTCSHVGLCPQKRLRALLSPS